MYVYVNFCVFVFLTRILTLTILDNWGAGEVGVALLVASRWVEGNLRHMKSEILNPYFVIFKIFDKVNEELKNYGSKQTN